MLTLWFNFGHQSDVSLAVQQGFSVISIDTWLEVIPQVRIIYLAFENWSKVDRVTS